MLMLVVGQEMNTSCRDAKPAKGLNLIDNTAITTRRRDKLKANDSLIQGIECIVVIVERRHSRNILAIVVGIEIQLVHVACFQLIFKMIEIPHVCPQHKMAASYHSRSNSLPSRQHPIASQIDDNLNRLRASQSASTSSSIGHNLNGLQDLHECVDVLLQFPLTQQALAQEKQREM
ncbi:hypothetical protein Goshw_024654, partial [Gossypium schwendimanii]|nr:hypothetical protein [Gossypium schwendimanii]